MIPYSSASQCAIMIERRGTALPVAAQLPERLGQGEQHRGPPVGVDRAEAPGVVVRAHDEPLVRELAAAQRAHHVRRPRQPPRLVYPHAHRQAGTPGQAVVQLRGGGPGRRRGGAGHARQDLDRRLVADRKHGYGVEGDLGGVEALDPHAAVEGQGRDEGGERIAGPGQGEDRSALDRLPVHHRALGVGGEIRRARIVEHDDRRRAPRLGELDLVAAVVPAVARDHDPSLYRHAHRVEREIVLAAALVGVHHLAGDVARARIRVPAVHKIRVPGKAVLGKRGAPGSRASRRPG